MGWFDQPDYSEMAKQQGSANVETANAEARLNNPDEYHPGYQINWHDNVDPNTGLMGRPTKAVTLHPTQQNIWNMQQDILQDVTAFLQNGLPNVQSAISGSYQVPGQAQGDISGKYAPSEYYQTDAGIDAAPGLYSNLDFSWAAPMPTADRATRDMVTQSIYDRGSGLLDQSYGQRQKALDTQLSNQGIFTGSQARENAQGAFDTQRQADYNDLALRAIEAGGAEMARDFGLGMQARQQSTGEILQQGQFRNDARGQMINELLSSMSQKNAGVNQAFNTALSQAGLSNAARLQQMQETAQGKLLPINVMLGILGGQQLNLPSAQPYSPTQITPPPIYQAGADQGKANAGMAGQGITAIASVAAAML